MPCIVLIQYSKSIFSSSHRPTRNSERTRDSPPWFFSQKFTGVKEYSKCLWAISLFLFMCILHSQGLALPQYTGINLFSLRQFSCQCLYGTGSLMNTAVTQAIYTAQISQNATNCYGIPCKKTIISCKKVNTCEIHVLHHHQLITVKQTWGRPSVLIAIWQRTDSELSAGTKTGNRYKFPFFYFLTLTALMGWSNCPQAY